MLYLLYYFVIFVGNKGQRPWGTELWTCETAAKILFMIRDVPLSDGVYVRSISLLVILVLLTSSEVFILELDILALSPLPEYFSPFK